MKLKRGSAAKPPQQRAAAGLKPQPRPKRSAGKGGGRAAAARGRGRGRGASRPGVSLRRRLAGRLPSWRRLLAGLGTAAAVAGLVALLAGPWLRVTDVAWAGDQFTRARDLERLLGRQRGVNLLALDTGALRDQLASLPAVASVTVSATLPGRLEATIVEREAAFVWETASARLLGATDGMLFAALRPDQALDPQLAALPLISDQRAMARLMTTGDRVPEAMLGTSLRLAGIDPAALGSQATGVAVRIDDEFGFRLVSADPAWQVALGVYGMDPAESATAAAARLERQITAVRTLFATRAETELSWIDVRNPGKVYFRAKG